MTCLLSVFTQCVIWLILNFAVSGSVFEIAAKLEIQKIHFLVGKAFADQQFLPNEYRKNDIFAFTFY